MRKKAEKAIREAAARIGNGPTYAIDQVRNGSGLIRKVYDKTVLDMARLGDVELQKADAADLDPMDIGRFIRRGEEIFTHFTLVTKSMDSPEPIDEPVEVVIQGFRRSIWEQFEKKCRKIENKGPAQKIKEMIKAYVGTEVEQE